MWCVQCLWTDSRNTCLYRVNCIICRTIYSTHLMDMARYWSRYSTRFHSRFACLPASQLPLHAPHSHCVKNLLRHQRYNLYKKCVSPDSRVGLIRWAKCFAYFITHEQKLQLVMFVLNWILSSSCQYKRYHSTCLRIITGIGIQLEMKKKARTAEERTPVFLY